MPRLAEYDDAWPSRYADEKSGIERALSSVLIAVEHVGSTSVPRLSAKPTIDIAAGVTTLDLPAVAIERMKDLGFEDALAESRPGERRFRRGASIPRDVIVHVVEWGGPEWRKLVDFRDALLADPQLAVEYAALKADLLRLRREWYSGEDKQEFIDRTLGQARDRAFVLARSAADTEALAANLAARLEPGDVVYVSGELGAGKTTFVRGACRALGVDGPVTSPTYTIGHRYDGVSHLDLYRFERLDEADWGALEPYFEDAIVFVEWPERAGGRLPAPRVTVRLAHIDADRRSIELASDDPEVLAGLI